MAGAFQHNAFQQDAFQMGHHIASTVTLQLPVDYALAGEQNNAPVGQRKGRLTFKTGRAQGRALRHTFNE